MSEEQQQVTEKYLFIITPLEIKSNSKIRSNNRKSLLIKLGNQTAKCSTLNTPVELQIDVIYSKTLQKYCPLKGIIKIYDVSQDGSEIISCVGGFQTDELLNQAKTKVLLEKEIGTSKLKMEISILNKGASGPKKQEEKGKATNEKDKEDRKKDTYFDDRRKELMNLEQRKKDRSSSLFRTSLAASRAENKVEGTNSIKRFSPMHRIEGNGLSSARQLDKQKTSLNLDTLQVSRNMFELQQNKKELVILKKLAAQKDKKIVSLQRQIDGAELTIRNLKETNKHLGQQNQYLRQKNQKVEVALYHKQTQISSLTNQVDKLNQQLQELDGKLYNSSLEIEQLKEEVSNNMEVVEKYREKYGEMKNVKNRAIEMEIKECLRWIQMQNRDLEMSQIEETTPSQHSEDRQASLSSVIRSIQIEKVPKEEMSIIRQELVRILQKVDDMMDK